MANPSTRSRMVLITVLATVLSILAASLPEWLRPSSPDAPYINQQRCDIGRQTCSAELLSDQTVDLHIQTANSLQIKPLNPITFVASLPANVDDTLILELTGREMYMGINRIPMQRVPGKPDTWQAETELAVCTTGSMVWQARLISDTNTNTPLATFEFMAE